MRVLCVAEKPSQAKEIAMKLSDATAVSRAGLDPYCRNYDFPLEWQGRRCEFVVTSVVGHVQELDFELKFRKWHACPPAALFTLPVHKGVAEGKRQVVENLQREARRADVVMVWTDCDREGENIGAEAAALARAVNPSLQICRARFSIMQAQDLKRACHNPAPLDTRLVDAVDARSEVDLRIGAALTRFQTLTLQSRFEPLRGGVISYGSCQFPTLGFVVERYLKRRDFVPEQFSKIAMAYTRDGIDVAFHWRRGQLYDPIVCVLLYEMCMENCMAHVTSYDTRPTTKWRPLPLTTVELQKMGSRYLHMPSDKVMEAANCLYQKGFISYPRTETDKFDPKFEFQPLLQKQLGEPRWGDYCRRLLAGNFTPPRAGKNDDGSHPPIHPTAAAPELNGDEAKVYELVARRFLAACSKDAAGLQTTVEVDIAGEKFTAKGGSLRYALTSGLRILELNYLEIYPYDKWSDKLLPPFRAGEAFMPTVLEMVDGETSPPALLSEAELIGIMSRNGIGTDATIHEHISKVLMRNYVYKDSSQRFAPSELGVGLVEGYDRIGLEKSLSKPFLRRELELSLKGICDGSRAKAAEVESALTMYFEMFTITTGNVDALVQAIAKYIPIAPDAAPPQPSVAIDTFRDMLNANPGAQPPKCRCDLFAVRLQAGAGANAGRWYFKCPSTRSCGFFSWVEGADAPPPRSRAPAGSHGVACYRCHQPGHFAPACPQSTAGSATRSRENPPTPGVTCFRCHQPGHLSTACPQGGSTRRSSARGGSTRGSSRGRGSRGRGSRGNKRRDQ
ncbi:DNA topoisomerase, partial [Massospora cicadina]